MNPIKTISNSIKGRLFESVVSSRLVYNTCWEDPRVDRRLLQLDSDSRVLMITSAGCNALDYLLDRPAHIDAVDINPAQNAIFELKRALFAYGDLDLLFDFFGRGACPRAPVAYRQQLRSYLPGYARRFWDRRINYFSKTTAEPSFYFQGTTGKVALMAHRLVKRKGLYNSILNLLNARTLGEQRYYFDQVEPELWNGFTRWLFTRDATMALLGIPAHQRRMIGGESDLLSYIRRTLRNVFTRIPLRDNYFWRVYLTGRYTPECCPNYLRREHFHDIAGRMDTIESHTSSLADFLAKTNESYTHIILLDHLDWLARANRPELQREWKGILNHSRPGTRILFRSAGNDGSFLPGFALERLRFNRPAVDELHTEDRVGTYQGTFVAEVTD